MVRESRVKNVVKQHVLALCESEAADEKLRTLALHSSTEIKVKTHDCERGSGRLQLKQMLHPTHLYFSSRLAAKMATCLFGEYGKF